MLMAFCIYCGCQVPDGAKFCGSCGARLDYQISTASQGKAQKTENVKTKRSKKPLAVIVILLVIALVATTTLVFVNHRQDIKASASLAYTAASAEQLSQPPKTDDAQTATPVEAETLTDAPAPQSLYPLDGEIRLFYGFNENGYNEGFESALAMWERGIGCELDADTPSAAVAKEAFSLRVSAGEEADSPRDLFFDADRFYASSDENSLTAAYKDEAIIDVAPYLEEYAPDYLKWAEKNDVDIYDFEDKALAFYGATLPSSPDAHTVSISTACDDIGTAVAAVNYLYTQEWLNYVDTVDT